jgi:hypothetical protein
MRNNAKDANLPRRIDGPGVATVPAASTATPAASAADGELPGRIDGSGRHGLSDSAASAATTPAGTQVRRTRINLGGRREMRRPLFL